MHSLNGESILYKHVMPSSTIGTNCYKPIMGISGTTELQHYLPGKQSMVEPRIKSQSVSETRFIAYLGFSNAYHYLVQCLTLHARLP